MKVRTWVKTFMPCMAPLVENGSKQQTVRPWPKRIQDIPRAGDRFSGREWTGKPYASKQRILREGPITEVLFIKIQHCRLLFYKIIYRKNGGIRFELLEVQTSSVEQWHFAKADGFNNLDESSTIGF